MKAWIGMVAAMLATGAPGVGASPAGTDPETFGADWLVSQGLLERELLDRATVVHETVLVPVDGAVRFDPLTNALEGVAIPTALPTIPPREVGCAGPANTFGYMSEPSGVAGIGTGCPFLIHNLRPHSSYLACAGTGGFASCFLSATNIDFLNFGFYGLFCNLNSMPVGLETINWQAGSSFTTANCVTFVFGSPPNFWNLWTGVCGGSVTAGAWKCSDLLRP